MFIVSSWIFTVVTLGPVCHLGSWGFLPFNVWLQGSMMEVDGTVNYRAVVLLLGILILWIIRLGWVNSSFGYCVLSHVRVLSTSAVGWPTLPRFACPKGVQLWWFNYLPSHLPCMFEACWASWVVAVKIFVMANWSRYWVTVITMTLYN